MSITSIPLSIQNFTLAQKYYKYNVLKYAILTLWLLEVGGYRL